MVDSSASSHAGGNIDLSSFLVTYTQIGLTNHAQIYIQIRFESRQRSDGDMEVLRFTLTRRTSDSRR